MEKIHGCTERKYITLRRRLDELGYHQPLSFEALLLVEKLLNDLLHTTDRLSQYKDLWKKNQQECEDFKKGVGPCMAENEKLIQERNYLKSKLLLQIEDTEKHQQKLKEQVRSLKDENSKLQFLNGEYISKVRNLEKELAERNHRIIQLQNENLQAVIITAGSAKAKQHQKQPILEIDHPIPVNKKWQNKYQSIISQAKDPCVVNMMSIADNKIDSLMKELEDIRRRNEDFEATIKSLRNEVIDKEKEIYCLRHKNVESSKFGDHSEQIAKYKKALSHPNMANDVLSLEKFNKDLKAQLKEALDRQHEAMEQAVRLADRNQELEKELHDIDHMALAVESECKHSMKENAVRVSKIQDRLESSLIRIHDLEQEILDLKHTNAGLKKQLNDKNKGKMGRQNGAEIILEEKKREVGKLNENVRDLTQKLEQLNHTIRSQKQRILELESKLLENARSWKRDKRHGSPLRSAEDHAWDRISIEDSRPCETVQPADKICVTFTDARTSPEAHLGGSSEELIAAKNDAQRLEEELNALRKQLQVETELHENEKAKLEESLTQAEECIKKLQLEQRELSSGRGSLRSVIHRHESTINRLEELLKNSQSELQREKNLNSQLKTLQEQTEHSLVEAQAKISQLISEQSILQDRIKGSEENSLKINKETKSQKVELNKLRDSLVQLDRDKDSLMIKIDEKTERIAGLESELKAKNSRISHLEQTIAEMKKKFDVTIDESVLRDHKRRSLQQEIERLQHELSTCRTHKENAIRENRRIQDDLASLTNDCRITHRELEDSRREVEDLKLQLQGYVDEVRRIEELLAHKEEERSDLLEQFRNLSAEASVLESTNHSLESETTDARMQLRLANDHLVDLERQLDDSHSLIAGYEQQISVLTRQVATFEMQFRTLEEQKSRHDTDLSASRELCRKLDTQKEQLMERISNSASDKASAEKGALQLRKDFEKLQSTIEINNVRISTLENKLLKKEKECLEEQMTNEELKREIERLQENILALEKKLEKEMAEVHKYQKKALEIGSQLGQMQKETDDPIRYGKKSSYRASTLPSKTQLTVKTKHTAWGSSKVSKTSIRTYSKPSALRNRSACGTLAGHVSPLEWTPPNSAVLSNFSVTQNLPDVHFEYESLPSAALHHSNNKHKGKLLICSHSSNAHNSDIPKSSKGSDTYRVEENSRIPSKRGATKVLSSPLHLRWHGTLPSGSEVSVAVDEKDDDDLLIRLDSPTNSYFSG